MKLGKKNYIDFLNIEHSQCQQFAHGASGWVDTT